MNVAEEAESGIEAGETVQPCGTSSRTAPEEFSTFLRIATETGNDLAPSGTTPARGAMATLIAGPTASGS